MPKLKTALTPRQKHFCENYVLSTSKSCGNASKSYELAGFGAKDCTNQAHKLMQNPNVQGYIAELSEKRLASYNWSKEDYLQIGIDAIKELPSTSSVRTKYYEIVGKTFGFFDQPVNVQNLIYNSPQNQDDSPSKSKMSKIISNFRKKSSDTINAETK